MIKKRNASRSRRPERSTKRTSPRKPDSKSRGATQPTEWDQAARWYDAIVGDRGTDYQKNIIHPGAYKLLDVKKGQRVLDLACGQGVFSRFMARKGIRAVGLDSSRELLKLARERFKSSAIFQVGDACEEEAFDEAVFEGVVCLMALQNMKEIEPVFQNVTKWMKPEGRFVMVLTHPCFRIARQTHWGWDEEKKMEFRRVDRYQTSMQIPILTPPFTRSKIYTSTYHRPLADYFLALSQAGLCVDRLEEWISDKESAPGKRARAENRARKEIPMFMAIRARHANFSV